MQRKTGDRIAYLDGLRGLAALAVAALHVFGEHAWTALPAPLTAVITRGYLGVQVFFVLSGFVIAQVLGRGQLDGRGARVFLLRRMSRLHPPYLASLAIAIAIPLLSNLFLHDRTAPTPPLSLVLAHVFYLQDFLGLPHIAEIYWTLCFEVQFYVVLLVIVAARQRLARRGVAQPVADTLLVWLPALYSVLALAELAPTPRGACFAAWCLFLAGVLTQQFTAGRLPGRLLALYLAVLVSVAALRNDPRPLVAALTAGSIALGHRRGQLERWLSSRPLQYLGKISYSLYLVHPVVGARLPNLGYRLTGDAGVFGWLWGLIGLGFALAASHVFWRYVEVPSIALARTIGRPRAAQGPVAEAKAPPQLAP